MTYDRKWVKSLNGRAELFLTSLKIRFAVIYVLFKRKLLLLVEIKSGGCLKQRGVRGSWKALGHVIDMPGTQANWEWKRINISTGNERIHILNATLLHQRRNSSRRVIPREKFAFELKVIFGCICPHLFYSWGIAQSPNGNCIKFSTLAIYFKRGLSARRVWSSSLSFTGMCILNRKQRDD